MTVGLSGPTINLAPGDEADFPDDEALRFIEAGFAVAIEGGKVERAVKRAPAKEKRG